VSFHLNSASVPILCYVTDSRSLGQSAPPLETLVAKIAAAIAAGVDWIQLREKDLSAKEYAKLTRAAVDLCSKSASNNPRTRILVNDRLDVAIAQNASGVHLGEQSVPVQQAKGLANKLRSSSSPPFLIGASCHSLNAAQSAATSGADYLIFGPIFETPSKTQFGPPQGLDRLAQICEAVSIPVLAVGGITLHNAQSCLAAGAAGVAAIRLFQDPSPAALPALVRALHALPRP
jgi:thiamine-phosphate pyrophosphorylase